MYITESLCWTPNTTVWINYTSKTAFFFFLNNESSVFFLKMQEWSKEGLAKYELYYMCVFDPVYSNIIFVQ